MGLLLSHSLMTQATLTHVRPSGYTGHVACSCNVNLSSRVIQSSVPGDSHRKGIRIESQIAKLGSQEHRLFPASCQPVGLPT